MRTEIFVTGFPKSGNTWLTRLIGDALDSPINAGKNKRALADEGGNRTGEYVIRQHHRFHPDGITIHIHRDPRDVLVSTYFYWRMKTWEDAMERICVRWKGYMDRAQNERKDVETSYEAIHADTKGEIERILDTLNLTVVNDLDEVIPRQAFDARVIVAKTYKAGGDVYHPAAQMRLLRKGIVGDWENYLTPAMCERVENCVGGWMRKLGYTEDEYWWQEIAGTG